MSQSASLKTNFGVSKRPASRDANPADSQGYTQPRQDAGSMHNALAYPQTAYGQPGARDYRHDYNEPIVKRQRSVGPYDRPQAQDAWPFCQPQQAPSLYSTHSLPQTSTYGHVGTSNAPSMDSFTFRSHPSMSGSQMADYSSGQAQNPYDPQTRYAQDASAHYGDSQGSTQRVAQPLAVGRHANPADHLQYQEMNRYGAVSNPDQRDHKYQYPAPPQSAYPTTENGSVLPPLSASGATGQPMVASASPYTYSTADARYAHPASQTGVQGNRAAYPGYPARNSPY